MMGYVAPPGCDHEPDDLARIDHAQEAAQTSKIEVAGAGGNDQTVSELRCRLDGGSESWRCVDDHKVLAG